MSERINKTFATLAFIDGVFPVITIRFKGRREAEDVFGQMPVELGIWYSMNDGCSRSGLHTYRCFLVGVIHQDYVCEENNKRTD